MTAPIKKNKKFLEFESKTKALIELPNETKVDYRLFDKQFKKLITEMNRSPVTFAKMTEEPEFLINLKKDLRISETGISQIEDILSGISDINIKKTVNSVQRPIKTLEDVLSLNDEELKEEKLIEFLSKEENTSYSKINILLPLYTIYLKKKNVEQLIIILGKFIELGLKDKIRHKYIYDIFTLIKKNGNSDSDLRKLLSLLSQMGEDNEKVDYYYKYTADQINYFILQEKEKIVYNVDSPFKLLCLLDDGLIKESIDLYYEIKETNLIELEKLNSFGLDNYMMQIIKEFGYRIAKITFDRNTDKDFLLDYGLAAFDALESISKYKNEKIILFSLIVLLVNVYDDEEIDEKITTSITFKTFLEEFKSFQENVFILESSQVINEIFRSFFYLNLGEFNKSYEILTTLKIICN